MQLNTLFPLTLTLSPREREQVSAIREHSLSREPFARRRKVPPLPGGEGWGEGNADLRLNRYG